jgi:dihydroneopterin aldolase
VPDRDEITLRAMRFHPRVGILPHERELAQPLEVDLTVWTTPRAASTLPGGVVDYRALYDLVAARVEAGPLDYIEKVAADIVAAARRLDGVVGARAAVRKPHVALPGPLLHAEVVVERGSRA